MKIALRVEGDVIVAALQQPHHFDLAIDGTSTDLHFRDMTNKIMHGTSYEWRLGDDDPKIVIHSNQPDRWRSAEVSIVRLMTLIGNLML